MQRDQVRPCIEMIVFSVQYGAKSAISCDCDESACRYLARSEPTRNGLILTTEGRFAFIDWFGYEVGVAIRFFNLGQVFKMWSRCVICQNPRSTTGKHTTRIPNKTMGS